MASAFITRSSAPFTTDALDAIAAHRRSYYTLITTGNASFRIALDTASADFWLVSSACTTDLCAVPKYQLGYQSPTFVAVNDNQTAFNVSFADGTGASCFDNLFVRVRIQ